MPTELPSDSKFEIGHVLFVDIVGYSKLLIEEQKERLHQLTNIVLATEQVREAPNEQLIRLPTGDGMALVFRNSSEEPARCALEIAEELKKDPEVAVRMGIHSGPVSEVSDVSGRSNLAGAGINLAQRVMDCGDAGHILVSQHVADDLMQYRQWAARLHDLGECEVKHGVRLRVANLYTDEIGNPTRPVKFKSPRRSRGPGAKKAKAARKPEIVPHKTGPRLAALSWIGIALFILILVGGGLWFFRSSPSPAQHRSVASPSGPRPVINVPEKSIAVLPFENLSSNKENAYFADGVQDEILTNLARIADLKVISRTSVMQYRTDTARNLREIGKQLGVAHLLEGSVQRADGRIRVNAQLIDARSDAHLWAQTYDRDLADVFAIQSEVAKAIADQLQAKILPAEKQTLATQPTKDIAAYDLYLRGAELIDRALNGDTPRNDLSDGIAFLEQAIARDPGFFRAYCKLAQAHGQFYLAAGDHTAARLASAGEATQAALRLQPDAPEAHLALASYLYSKLDYDGARAQIEIARRNLPNEPTIFELSGYIDRRQGRSAESTRNLERALELDPNNIVVLQQIAESYDQLREYHREIAVLDRVLALRPKDSSARLSRAQVEVRWKADPKPLHDLIESLLQENRESGHSFAGTRVFLALAERDAESGLRALADLDSETFGPDALQHPVAYGEGVFARLKGDVAAAEMHFLVARAKQAKIVEAQPDYGPALCVLGEIDAALGRKEDALREGRRAADLTPLTKDAINGKHIMARLAAIYGWVGEKDLAIEQLTRVVETTGGPSYGVLRLFPDWDPLRGDPRFEKIVASLAPK
jgi:TolB-like protein/Tfp pilus assembly protein PilF